LSDININVQSTPAPQITVQSIPAPQITVQSTPAPQISVLSTPAPIIKMGEVVEVPGNNAITFIYNETPTGARDGSNAIYTTQNLFIPETVCVFCGGIALSPLDYHTEGSNTIHLNESPQAGESVRVNYTKL
jgi:hypothetical protein